jgi:acetoin utilization deacetylase AcuC-like enzyme
VPSKRSSIAGLFRELNVHLVSVMVSSFSKVAVAAFTSFVSHPSSSYFHRSALRGFGLCNYRNNQYRSLHSPNFLISHSIANGGTIPSNRRTNARSSSTTRSHQKETTLVSSSSVSSSPPRSSASDTVSKSDCQTIRAQKSLTKLIAASRSGLDPSLNRFHAPLVYHDGYSSVPDWPPKHTFPMTKFERTSHALLTTTSKTIATSNLPRPIVRSKEDYFRPPDFSDVPIEEWLDLLNNNNNNDGDDVSASRACNDDDNTDDDGTNLETRPKTDFHHRFLRGQLTREEARMIGFREQTHRPELVERTVLEVAGTVLTAQLALKYGIASNLAGGTHHAHPNGGAGYTIMNDLAIATNLLTTSSSSTTTNNDDSTTSIRNDSKFNKNAIESDTHTSGRRVDRVLVIDCDVHQGDGTAQYSTLWKNDRRLFTLSIHCESNYPFLKQNSTYDVGLPDHCNDQDYLIALKDSVNRAIHEVRPDLVLYDAGVDVYKHDTLGRLDLTEEDGIRQRDRWVLDRCVSLGIPIAAVVGGGYDKDLDALGRRHAIVHEECAYIWRKYKLWRRFQNVADNIRG